MILSSVISFWLLLFSWSIIPDSIQLKISEQPSDSAKVDYLIDQSWSFARVNPDMSFNLLSKLDSIISQSGSDYGKDVMFYYYGIIYKNSGQFDQSEQWLRKYYDFHKAKDNERHLAVVTMALANLYSDQGKWAKSMESVLESRRLYESQNDTLGVIRAGGKLGYVLTQLDRHDDAMRYHKESSHLASLIQNDGELSIAHSNIGNTFEHLNELDSAFYHYLKSEEINRRINDKWGLVYDMTHLGRLNLKEGNKTKALEYATEGFALSKEIGSNNLIAMTQLLHGVTLIENEEYSKGIQLLEDLIESEELSTSLKELKETHQSLYEAYKKSDQKGKALFHLEKVQTLSDSLLNVEISRQVNSLEYQYDTEKKEQEIDLLNAQNEVATLRLKASNRRNIAFGMGIGLLGIFSIFIYRLYQKIQSQNAVISKALNEKDTLLREIHHRVKNNLQFVSSLLNLQSRHVEDQTALTALKEGQNRVKSMALIHQNLYQEDNLTGIEIKEYLEKLTQSLFDSYNVSPDRVQLEMEIVNVNLDVDTVIPLGLIINELISNALKHAFPNEAKGTIHVLMKEEDNHLILIVKDNGVGLDTENEAQMKKSFGYRLINAFKSQLDADLNINGTNGTSVEMRIKDYQKVA